MYEDDDDDTSATLGGAFEFVNWITDTDLNGYVETNGPSPWDGCDACTGVCIGHSTPLNTALLYLRSAGAIKFISVSNLACFQQYVRSGFVNGLPHTSFFLAPLG